MKLSDVKFSSIDRKDYEDEVVVGNPIENFPEYQEYMMKFYYNVTRKDFDRSCGWLGDNRAKFKKHFGKCAFTYNGGHYFHGWLVDLGTTQVIVLTAREHGTCYEVVTMRDGEPVPTDPKRVIEFMEMIGDLPE